MTNILVPTGDTLNLGTTGDDIVTFEDSLAGDNVGNGGDDIAILTKQSLAELATGYFNFGVTTADVWTETDAGATLDVSFTSVTTSDGFTIKAGVALAAPVVTFDARDSGLFGGGITDNSTTDGSYGAYVVAFTSKVSWNGSELEDITPTWTLVSFDGNTAAALATAPASDGAGSLTVDPHNEIVSFTPNTTALAGDYNVGDVVDFTYDMVLSDGTADVTVPVTYSITIGWTAGDDVYTVTDADGEDVVDGNNSGTTPPATGTVLVDAGNDLLLGGDGDDSLYGGAGSDTLKGGNGDDRLFDADATNAADVNILGGGAGDDYIDAEGSLGNNKLIGAGGNDKIYGGNGDDAIQGGAGIDELHGDPGNDTIRGGDGADYITGGAGNDELRGGAGKDVVNGSEGNDIIYTSLGGDELWGDQLGGDAGDDSFILKPGTGDTTIKDFGNGNDKLDVSALGYTNLAAVLAVSYDLDMGGTVIQIDEDTSVTLEGVALADLAIADFDFA